MHTCCTWCKGYDVGSHGCMLSVFVDEIALVAMIVLFSACTHLAVHISSSSLGSSNSSSS